MTNSDLMRIEKLVALVASGNNGSIRLDCVSPTAYRLLRKHQEQMESLGVAVFTASRGYTPAGYAAAAAVSNRECAKARAVHRARAEADFKADYALDAMLARAERMTMTA